MAKATKEIKTETVMVEKEVESTSILLELTEDEADVLLAVLWCIHGHDGPKGNREKLDKISSTLRAAGVAQPDCSFVKEQMVLDKRGYTHTGTWF